MFTEHKIYQEGQGVCLSCFREVKKRITLEIKTGFSIEKLPLCKSCASYLFSDKNLEVIKKFKEV